MSLSDTLRLLRARRGGVTPIDIEAATGVPKGVYRQMEQRYRAVGDDDTIRLLADYYAVPFDELRWQLDWPRKALNRALVTVMERGQPITLALWNGQTVTGTVQWWDLGALGLETPEEGLLVIQRHAVQRWSSHAAEDAAAT